MKTKSIASFLIGTALAVTMAGAALAQDKAVKIGALSDQSGLYADLGGPGSTLAAQMAVEDSGLAAKGWKIDIISGDHQNKPDIGTAIARQWFDVDKVDMITDFPTASTALAVMEIARQKNRVTMPSAGLSTAILGEKCSPLNAQWTTNTYALAAGTARALVKDGKKTWYFITADYTFGHSLEKDATEVIQENGGNVVGVSRHPFPGNDFSSFLLKAQASKADVIALANAGNDTVNAVKQANEFGITKKQIVAPLLTYISDVHSMGLAIGQDINLVEAFYWDQSPESRQWSERFYKVAGRMPSGVQASNYAATLHYLKAVQAAGTDEAGAIEHKTHGQLLDRDVVHDLVVGALQERRVDGAERLIALGRKTRRERHAVLLGDADVEGP